LGLIAVWAGGQAIAGIGELVTLPLRIPLHPAP
jgi:hypothetical protein